MKRRVQILVALALTALWGAGIYAGHANGHLRFLDRLEATLTDWRTQVRGVQAPPDLVTIVAIDDTVVKRGGSYPLPRADLARVVDTIVQFKPKVVAIDLLLVDRSAAIGDATLANTLATGPMILAAAAIFPSASETVAPSSDGPLAVLPQAERFLLPLPAFADHAEVGVVNVATGQSGSPLSVPMLFRTSDKVELSFPLRVAIRALDKPLTIAPDHLLLGDHTVPTDTDFALPITYYGPRRTIRTVSAQSIFDGTLNRSAIENRIVVIGASVAGGGDFYPTPFDSLMPGVEVVSTAITHLVAGDGIVRDRKVHIADALIAILLPMLLVGLLAWRRSALGLVAAAGVMIAWAGLNLFAFTHGVWLNAATTLAAAVPPVVVFGGVQLWAGGRRTQYLAAKSRSLAQFQAPAVQDWLARDPNFLSKPVRQDAAVVFIDLSGFTALSERIDPDELQDILKALHALIDKGRGRLRRHDQRLSRRRRHDPVRPARRDARRRRTRAEMRDRPAPRRRTLDRVIAPCDQGSARLQDRRAFRPDRRLPPRRKPSAHHGDGRHRQCREPVNGGRRPERRAARAQRYAAGYRRLPRRSRRHSGGPPAHAGPRPLRHRDRVVLARPEQAEPGHDQG
ncbi:adenylate cyclase [Bradyrhizobium sp. LB13.1]